MGAFLWDNMSAEDKLIKTRVGLQKGNPFFGYILMYCKFKDGKDITETIAVDNKGSVYFNEKFINTLSEEECKGVLAHEAMHCVFRHLDYSGVRDPKLSNISDDIAVNNILLKNNFTLPKGGLIPNNDNIDIKGLNYNVKNINDKVSSEMYDEIYRAMRNEKKNNKNGLGKIASSNSGFDDHKRETKDEHEKAKNKGNGGDEDGDGIEDGVFGDGNQNWKDVLAGAIEFSKKRGTVPSGMDRIIDKVNETYIPWRGILYRFITNQIPFDYSWSRPSKRSRALGIYLPVVTKESIDIIVAVDTSGSISRDELEDFLSEITSIVDSINNVNLTVIVCDCRITGTYELKGATYSDVMQKIKIKGGGGTSHIPVFDWINENKPNAKLAICFTDGYTDFPKEEDAPQNTIWVSAGNYRLEKEGYPFGEVIELPLTE